MHADPDAIELSWDELILRLSRDESLSQQDYRGAL
jgi:hypothetical protein